MWLSEPSMGVHVGSSSLLIDLPGMFLIGTGILATGWRSRENSDEKWYVHLCGSLILGSVLASATWRWGIPRLLDMSYVDVLNGILDSEDINNMFSALELRWVSIMLVTWAASSIMLMAGVLLLRIRGLRWVTSALLESRPALNSWEGFVVLNALGTMLLVSQLMVMVNGGDGTGILTAALVMKTVIIPFNGIVAYAMLAYRARKLSARPSPHHH
ncbi:MAG: hypothetical protein QXJ32_03030 [Thermoplasmata archaeon]